MSQAQKLPAKTPAKKLAAAPAPGARTAASAAAKPVSAPAAAPAAAKQGVKRGRDDASAASSAAAAAGASKTQKTVPGQTRGGVAPQPKKPAATPGAKASPVKSETKVKAEPVKRPAAAGAGGSKPASGAKTAAAAAGPPAKKGSAGAGGAGAGGADEIKFLKVYTIGGKTPIPWEHMEFAGVKLNDKRPGHYWGHLQMGSSRYKLSLCISGAYHPIGFQDGYQRAPDDPHRPQLPTVNDRLRIELQKADRILGPKLAKIMSAPPCPGPCEYTPMMAGPKKSLKTGMVHDGFFKPQLLVDSKTGLLEVMANGEQPANKKFIMRDDENEEVDGNAWQKLINRPFASDLIVTFVSCFRVKQSCGLKFRIVLLHMKPSDVETITEMPQEAMELGDVESAAPDDSNTRYAYTSNGEVLDEDPSGDSSYVEIPVKTEGGGGEDGAPTDEAAGEVAEGDAVADESAVAADGDAAAGDAADPAAAAEEDGSAAAESTDDATAEVEPAADE